MTSDRLPVLPAPYATPSTANFATVVGWPDGLTPTAPAGFTVSGWATGLDYPRWFHLLPNGDVLVSEARTLLLPSHDRNDPGVDGNIRSRAMGTSANRITLLRDADGDGAAEVRTTFLEGLDRPFGMARLDNQFYVAATDGLWIYPYRSGQTRLEGPGKKILELPAGGYNNHWTRNVVVGPGGNKLYITVGSASNVAEYGIAEEERRANILEVDPDGSHERIFAAGLRNPVGLDWEPVTGATWTAVNERDELGDELVPDHMTSVRDGGFYGWPYAYFGQIEDPRLAGQRPDLVEKSIVPDMALGSHTASLGLLFYRGSSFPEHFHGGAFVGQHGSWNRAELSGYKVVYVPFRDGQPSGPMQDFLTGFICADDPNEVYGRPCGLLELADGSMLVADDAADTIWRVTVTADGAIR